MDKVLKLNIPIPIGDDGKFDKFQQDEIACIYNKIDEIRQSILDELDKVTNTEIDFD